MAVWHRLWGLVTGASYRSAGIQNGTPAYTNDAAVPVTVDSALQLSAAWSCVRLISETIGAMPPVLYEVKANGAEVPVKEHPLAMMFNGKMNAWQTCQEYFESITYQIVLGGNNYSQIQRSVGKNKDVIGLVPLMDAQMQVELRDNGSVLYRYANKDQSEFTDQTCWHNKLFGNGVIGLSPLAYARNSLGIGLGADASVSKIYRNGGKPAGVLMIDKVLKEGQREKIKENFDELVTGNSQRLFVLEADMKYQQVSLSPQDIEMLASRRFQIEDICRFFGVPSVLVNDTQAGTTWGTGIGQIFQGFYKMGLRPYLSRYEQSMKSRLLTPEERTKFKIKFDFNSFLQPEFSERIKSSKEGVTGGIMTPNQARRIEGWEPLEGGDSLYMQQQMVPIEKLKDMPRGNVQDANRRADDKN